MLGQFRVCGGVCESRGGLCSVRFSHVTVVILVDSSGERLTLANNWRVVVVSQGELKPEGVA